MSAPPVAHALSGSTHEPSRSTVIRRPRRSVRELLVPCPLCQRRVFSIGAVMQMHRRMLWALVLCWMSVVVGCDFSDSHDDTRTEQDTSPRGSNETGTEVFESDDPILSNHASGDDVPVYDGGASDPDNGGGGPSGDPAPEIAEAGVIQNQGNRLYALSRRAGLAIVDISNPDELALLGRFPSNDATPFEMHLRGDVVIALLSDGWKGNVNLSQLVAIDVSEPSAPIESKNSSCPASLRTRASSAMSSISSCIGRTTARDANRRRARTSPRSTFETPRRSVASTSCLSSSKTVGGSGASPLGRIACTSPVPGRVGLAR